MPRSLWQCTETVTSSMPVTCSISPRDERAEHLGVRVAGGVGDVHDRRAGGDRPPRSCGRGTPARRGRRPRRRTRRRSTSERASLTAATARSSASSLADAQLVAQVRLGDADAGVDARARGASASASAATSMSLGTARESAHDDRRVAHLGADARDALEVAGARDREAGLDDVDAEPHELARDLELLLGVHATRPATARRRAAWCRRCRRGPCSSACHLRVVSRSGRRGRRPACGRAGYLSRPSAGGELERDRSGDGT